MATTEELSNATNNLKLTKFAAGDYVNYDTFNKNFDKIDTLGTDYVIKQGTSGEWSYRVWNSGTIECWISSKSFGSETATTWGVVWATWKELSFGSYPTVFKFSTAPTVCISSETDYFYGLATAKSTDPKTISPRISLWRPDSGGLTFSDIKLSIYAIGTGSLVSTTN